MNKMTRFILLNIKQNQPFQQIIQYWRKKKFCLMTFFSINTKKMSCLKCSFYLKQLHEKITLNFKQKIEKY